ncbi:MAG: alpha/beta hydrolase-fold protein [Acidimicrobiia bacterium]|nr:alpha/beta hydrolase-fold protein [Acidimicrobiia bacterium]
MRIRTLWLVLALAACASPPATGVFLDGVFDVPDELVTAAVPADEMRYLIHFPAEWSPGSDVPLVVFLHGSGDADYDTRWVTAYGLPAAVRFDALPADVEPFVLLVPQATPGTSWAAGKQPETVVALIDQVIADHDLPADRVALTGVSMGGYGAWHIASRFPDRFSAVVSVSGSGYGTTELPTDIDVCALAQTSLRAYHGDSDMISLLALNLELIRAWEERCGSDVDLRVLAGEGHFTTAQVVYEDPAFYDWLLRD